MNNRRGFLTALTAASSAGFAFILSTRTRAQPVIGARARMHFGAAGVVAAAATTQPVTLSSAPPSDEPRHAPSAAALATAATFRRFDPALTDAEIATIAAGIDDNAKAGALLNPARKPLRNSDEPVTRFAADESVSA